MGRVDLDVLKQEQLSVATITINNPDKLNVLNSATVEALRDRLDAVMALDDLGVVVVTGAGPRSFIGGADLRELATLNVDTAREFISGLHQAIAAIRRIPVPVIARVNGYCLGAGLEVAAGCDMRVATAAAMFGMPEVRVGLPSVIEAALLPGLIGWGRTNQLVLTGDMIGADEALACGLVEKVVAEDALDAAVAGWVDSILASGPIAVRAQKRLVRCWEQMDLDDAISAGIDYLADAYATDEPHQLMQNFLKRKDEA